MAYWKNMLSGVGLDHRHRPLSGRVLPAFRVILMWMTLGLRMEFFTLSSTSGDDPGTRAQYRPDPTKAKCC